MYESMILSTKNFLTILKFLKLGLKKLSKNSKNGRIGKILYRCATTTHKSPRAFRCGGFTFHGGGTEIRTPDTAGMNRML